MSLEDFRKKIAMDCEALANLITELQISVSDTLSGLCRRFVEFMTSDWGAVQTYYGYLIKEYTDFTPTVANRVLQSRPDWSSSPKDFLAGLSGFYKDRVDSPRTDERFFPD
jgi:hypothetical protein